MRRETLSGLLRRIGDGNRSGRSYAMTMLTPIRAGAEADVAGDLAALSRTQSPFRDVTSVHFARWVVIDQLKMCWLGAPTPRPALKSQYLLFTACATVFDAKSLLSALTAAIPETVDQIWGHCLGYPLGAAQRGDRAAVKYLARGLVDTSLFFVGYPDVTPAEVNSALTGRENFLRFVLEHQGWQDSAALQRVYIEESALWYA